MSITALLISLALLAPGTPPVSEDPSIASPGVESSPPVAIEVQQVVAGSDGVVETRSRRLLGPDETGLVVLVLTSTTCPIANASTPSVRRLAAACERLNARIVLVHPDRLAKADSIWKHATSRQLGEIMLVVDREHRIVERLDARVVPEVFVLRRVEADWICGYRGPIDDLYAGIGRRRRAASRFYAIEAVERLAGGQVVEPARRIAHGCAIERKRSP